MAKTKDTALVTQQARHYMRYLRNEQGETAEEIARTEGVSVKVIERSIKQIALHRSINTQGNLNAAVVGMLLGNLKGVDKGIKKALSAKKFVERRLTDGSTELIPIDDTDAQMEALRVFTKMVETMQPKGGGLAVSVNSNNQTAHITNARSGGFEDRLAKIRKDVQEHNLLAPVTVDAIEADPDDEDENEDEEGDEA